MKKIILSLFIIFSISIQAVTDRKMKMKMEVDRTPNMIIINIIPETEKEYIRLLEIIEKSQNKELVEKLKKHLENLKEKKSYLIVKEEKNVQKK